MNNQVACVVGGAGPAGIGFLFNAMKCGALPAIAANGLEVIDRRVRLGAGRLGDYDVTANSVSDVFLDCLRSPILEPVFRSLGDSEVLRLLRLRAHEALPLSIPAQLLEEAAECFLEHVADAYGVVVRRGTHMESIVCGAHGLAIACSDGAGNRYTVHTRSLVLNTGGREDPSQGGMLLERYGVKLGTAMPPLDASSEVLSCSEPTLLARYASRLRKHPRIAVLGGSHSALSVVDRLARLLQPHGLKEAVILHRSPLKLFYETTREATDDGYCFDPVADVCPKSGRVNRSSGLRYRAFDIGKTILAHGHLDDARVGARLIRLDEAPARSNRGLSDLLSQSAAIVQCIGYQPDTPPLWRSQGEPITLRTTNGGIVSDESGCPLDLAGEPVPGLFMFGLGAGQAVNLALGSEPSFKGRITGVWQFHHDASRCTVDAVLRRARAVAHQPCLSTDLHEAA